MTSAGRERGLVAERALAAMFATGASIALLGIVLSPLDNARQPWVSLNAALGYPAALLLLAGRGRFPAWVLNVLLASGTVLVSIGVYLLGGGTSSGAAGALFVWVSLYSFHFFPPRHAAAHLALGGAGFATSLGALGEPDAAASWLLIHGTATVAGVIVASLAAELRKAARVDQLTGVANRRAWEEAAEREVLRARREGTHLAVAVMDLDDLKATNDRDGHVAGDALLIALAGVLRRQLRAVDLVARLGGDEFGILLPNIGSEEAVAVVSRVHAAAETRFSTGISEWARDESINDTVARADRAMYKAKAVDRGGVAVATCANDETGDRIVGSRTRTHGASTAGRDLEMQHQLRRAVERGELFLRYHPQVDLASGEIVAVEALLRWAHPERGELAPADFMAVAEATGLIVPIGGWVLSAACPQLAEWRQTLALPLPLRVTVNVSARQLAAPGFVDLVRETLDVTVLPPAQIELEITESMIVAEDRGVANAVRELRALGVSVAVDDFGTAYSSLSHLHRFPVDRLKLDRSVVAELGGGSEGTTAGEAAIVGAAIAMAHALGLAAVAEGVETQEQLDALRAFGCEQGQGYLSAHPLLAEEVPGFLCPA